MFSTQFESLRVHVIDCTIDLKRRHMQVLHQLNIYTTFNCPVVQISALDVVFVCFIYTDELRYKVLKYYVVVKHSHYKVSVVLWRSLKWLLLSAKYSHALSNENEVECRCEFWKRDVNRNSDCDLRSCVALLSDLLYMYYNIFMRNYWWGVSFCDSFIQWIYMKIKSSQIDK